MTFQDSKARQDEVEGPESSVVSSETAHDVGLEKSGGVDVTGHRKKTSGYISWNGSEDPEHPQNWPLWTKLRISVLLTFITLGVSMGSSIFGPGAQEMSKEFGISSEVSVLGTSLYLLVRIEQIPGYVAMDWEL